MRVTFGTGWHAICDVTAGRQVAGGAGAAGRRRAAAQRSPLRAGAHRAAARAARPIASLLHLAGQSADTLPAPGASFGLNICHIRYLFASYSIVSNGDSMTYVCVVGLGTGRAAREDRCGRLYDGPQLAAEASARAGDSCSQTA